MERIGLNNILGRMTFEDLFIEYLLNLFHQDHHKEFWDEIINAENNSLYCFEELCLEIMKENKKKYLVKK